MYIPRPGGGFIVGSLLSGIVFGMVGFVFGIIVWTIVYLLFG